MNRHRNTRTSPSRVTVQILVTVNKEMRRQVKIFRRLHTVHNPGATTVQYVRSWDRFHLVLLEVQSAGDGYTSVVQIFGQYSSLCDKRKIFGT
jgi:hypothetical protein